MAVKNINLEVSEHTHERKDLIVVGTAFARGEDIASRGCIYVFDVIEVVPDPERPEANRKLKLVGKEPVKGAVTALSGIGGQGFLIVAQGQKCMVRGLKEDGSLLPVAFMDMQCYVNVVKELKGTGLCILGDALKGLWFTGYSVITPTASFDGRIFYLRPSNSATPGSGNAPCVYLRVGSLLTDSVIGGPIQDDIIWKGRRLPGGCSSGIPPRCEQAVHPSFRQRLQSACIAI